MTSRTSKRALLRMIGTALIAVAAIMPLGATGADVPAKAAPVKLVDINSASVAALKTLPGIGDAEAKKIIDGRPYLSKANLATRNVLPTGVYLSLKNLIIAKQSGKPIPKK